MSGAIPSLPQYVLIAWSSVKRKSTRTTLPLPLFRLEKLFYLALEGLTRYPGIFSFESTNAASKIWTLSISAKH
jgi:hypothetical protein